MLGEIVGAFGVRGWLKVRSFTDPPENILNYGRWRLTTSERRTIEVELESGRSQGRGLITKLKGCSDRDSAEAFLGYEIWVSVHQLPDLADDEYYWYQLESLRVVNLQGFYLGDVSHLLETGANDVLVLKPSISSVDGCERMIPYLPGKTVVEVALKDKQIVVDWDVDYQ